MACGKKLLLSLFKAGALHFSSTNSTFSFTKGKYWMIFTFLWITEVIYSNVLLALWSSPTLRHLWTSQDNWTTNFHWRPATCNIFIQQMLFFSTMGLCRGFLPTARLRTSILKKCKGIVQCSPTVLDCISRSQVPQMGGLHATQMWSRNDAYSTHYHFSDSWRSDPFKHCPLQGNHFEFEEEQ